jgi:hypothetical protein
MGEEKGRGLVAVSDEWVAEAVEREMGVSMRRMGRWGPLVSETEKSYQGPLRGKKNKI